MSKLITEGDLLVGKYRIERVLGIGGMGMVLAAMHLDLEQRVAIKVMLPDVMNSPKHVERFLREAKSAVKLRNEHVCRVLDVGKGEDGAPFIVMEFLDGKDLGEVLASSGPLPVVDAVDYVLQAIEGIAEAHANHIVHRDLKPQNLFVTHVSDGSPLIKVLDFGISKSSVAGSATKTGDIMGSPSYMAPEQMLSTKTVDSRVDVWAIGVILYQVLTGRLPFEGESLAMLCMAVIHEEPPRPITLRPDLPLALEAAIMRCLKKQLPERFPNVASLARALAPFGSTSAAASAERVTKVLHRASSPVVTHDEVVEVGPLAAAAMSALQATPLSSSNTHGHVSTLQASVGAIDGSPTPPHRARRGLLLGVTALALGLVITTAVIASKSGHHAGPSARTTNTQPAASPTTSVTAAPGSPATLPPPSPVSAPSAPPNVAPAQPAVTSDAPAQPAVTRDLPEARPLSAMPATPTETRSGAGAATDPSPTPRDPRKRTTPTKNRTPTLGGSAKAKPGVSCDPPYTVDATGKRLYKSECL